MLKAKFYPEDGGRKFLRNNDYMPENVASILDHCRLYIRQLLTWDTALEVAKAVPYNNRLLVLVIPGLMHIEGTALSAGHNTP
jgi:hypothetical protein